MEWNRTLREMTLQSDGSWVTISQVTNPNIARNSFWSIPTLCYQHPSITMAQSGKQSDEGRGSGGTVKCQRHGSDIGNKEGDRNSPASLIISRGSDQLGIVGQFVRGYRGRWVLAIKWDF
jgi:hypothetical protein